MHFDLTVIEVSSGRHVPCVVTTSESPESCRVTVSSDGAEIASGRGYDFEEALQGLRAELESHGRHLLCNRYRRDAFVTSLSRQMSGGLGCYLVVPVGRSGPRGSSPASARPTSPTSSPERRRRLS